MTAVLERAPLERAPLETVEVTESALRVVGVRCKNEHFNDPAVCYCAICGVSMAQADRPPVLDSRPPLGVLVLDDGTLHPLSRDLVLGRAPQADEAVAAGLATPVPLFDAFLSRVHARITLDGWKATLVDAGSRNGTFVCPPGQQVWTRLPSGGRVALTPGTAVALGRRNFCYHSHRNR